MIKAHYLQQVPFEDPAYIFDVLKEMNIPFMGSHVYRYDPYPNLGDFDLLVIMGGPMGVYDKQFSWLPDEIRFIEAVIKSNKKIIGICLGAQFLASVLGAKVYKNSYKEIGWFKVKQTETAAKDACMRSIFPDAFYAFHWHGDTFNIPKGALHLAKSEACVNQAFVYDNRILGLQFHLESTETSIQKLVQNCGEEIKESPFIQKKHKILKKRYIQGSNFLMKKIIEKMINTI